jgi:hypothetical protein
MKLLGQMQFARAALFPPQAMSTPETFENQAASEIGRLGCIG